jgi:acyl-CoA synthetase (AMP-forming)/AMP-acid ligase II
LLRQENILCCINLDGHVIYRYNILGCEGLALDQQGHVYICGRASDDIRRNQNFTISTDVNFVLYSSDTPTPFSYLYLFVLCIVSGVDKLYGVLTLRDIVLSEHDGVDRPEGITFNNDFTKLFILNREGETVLVYSCK